MGSLISQVIFTMEEQVSENCFNVHGTMSNSGWQADYQMCKQ
jgi:hypothetical protein